MKKRVFVGLSGGVDSSVAAYILKKQGYDVVGVFMKNWHDASVTKNQACPWIDDVADALIVAQQLSIPFHSLDLSRPYQQHVVEYMFDAYRHGLTPNPDVLCNEKIKFSLFRDAAIKLGADFIATGHYCRKQTTQKQGKTIYRLLAGIDNNKDQSYFLCRLTQNQLAKALFPLGELTKIEVRSIAHRLRLTTAKKSDSQGLCFVGKIDLPQFLQQKLKPQRGPLIEIPQTSVIFKRDPQNTNRSILTVPYPLTSAKGITLGEHQGAHYYTIGQRKGLKIGGSPSPLFVIGLDVQRNIVYVGQGSRHPGLYRKGLFVAHRDEHWIRDDIRLRCGESQKYDARIRYRQPLVHCRITKRKEGLYVIFDEPQRGIAPGQFVAWYKKDEIIGSGVIG